MLQNKEFHQKRKAYEKSTSEVCTVNESEEEQVVYEDEALPLLPAGTASLDKREIISMKDRAQKG